MFKQEELAFFTVLGKNGRTNFKSIENETFNSMDMILFGVSSSYLVYLSASDSKLRIVTK